MANRLLDVNEVDEELECKYMEPTGALEECWLRALFV